MFPWSQYLRTAAITLALASPVSFVARSYYDTKNQLNRAELMLETHDRERKEVMEDIRWREGWHLCGMETMDEQHRVYQRVRATPSFRAWSDQTFAREKASLGNLLCDPSVSTYAGLFSIAVSNLVHGNIIDALDGPQLDGYSISSFETYYCRN